MRRKILDKLYQHSSKKEWTVLIGARQIGKSTVMKDLATKLKSEGKSVVQLNLERILILNDLNTNPDNIFLYVPVTTERVYVLIDEIQYLDNPSNFLKHIFDEYADKVKLIVTGSSAFYIDKNFNDSLAGRKRIFELYTFDFEEYLMLLGEDNLLEDLYKFKNNKLKKFIAESRLWALIENYVVYGGYPNVIQANSESEKIMVLEDIKDSFIKKDMLESGIRDADKFFMAMNILSDQVGNLVNVNELSNTIKAKNETIENYIYILQKCFHIHLVRPFYNNLRKELTKMPKVFFNDTGLRNCMRMSFQKMENHKDKGALFENFVFTQLRNANNLSTIKYWRTADGNEVDFIIGSSSALEIKYSNTDNKESKYKLFKSAYPDIDFGFINWRTDELLRLLLASNIYE